jgi:predicted TIM-barrel fold metal-dependent hydrolase
MLITDAQVHLWEVDRPGRPWPSRPQRRPHRPNGFSAEATLAEMGSAGVDRAVIVPPHWVGENNAFAIETAERYPGRFGVVGRIDLKASEAPAELRGWLQQPHMLGVRATFHTKPFSDWLDDSSIEWFWTICEQLAIPVLKQRDMTPQEDPVTGFYVKDPDGFPVQLISDDPKVNEGYRIPSRR